LYGITHAWLTSPAPTWNGGVECVDGSIVLGVCLLTTESHALSAMVRFVLACGKPASEVPFSVLKRKWVAKKSRNVDVVQELVEDAAINAIRAKRINVARWLVESLVHRLTTETRAPTRVPELHHMFREALMRGAVDFATWLFQTSEGSWCLPSLLPDVTLRLTDFFCAAAESGSIAAVEFLDGLDGCDVLKSGDAAVCAACRSGSLETVERFFEKRPRWAGDVWAVSNAFIAACECPNAGAPDVVSWLWDKLGVMRATVPLLGSDKKSAMYKAVNFGHRDVVRFLFDVAGIGAHYASPLPLSDIPYGAFFTKHRRIPTSQVFEVCLREHGIVSPPVRFRHDIVTRFARWQQALRPGVAGIQIVATRPQLPASAVVLVGVARAYHAFVMTAVLHWRRASRAAFFQV
jgi:hypothetical protein